MNIRSFDFLPRVAFVLVFLLCAVWGTGYAESPRQFEIKRLMPSDSAPFDDYGIAVAVAGDTAVIGIPFDDTKAYRSGSAYVYARNADVWNEQQKLTASHSVSGDRYGIALGLEDDTLLVGTYIDYEKGSLFGSAYAQTASAEGWSEAIKLQARDLMISDASSCELKL